MTQSKGKGRGGARKGAGRKRKSATTDWNEIGRAYFVGREHAHVICAKFNVSHADLLAYAAARGWIWPSPDGHPDDFGELGSALAVAMFDVNGGVQERARCFVRAMVALGAGVRDIADALHVTGDALRTEFAKELAR